MDTHPKETLHDRSKASKKYNNLLNVDDQKKAQSLDKSFLSKYLDNNKFMNFFANGILVIAIISYLITLYGCHEASQAECLKKFDQTLIKYFVLVLLTSAFLFTLIYNLTIYKKIHYVISIYTTVIIAFLCFVYDTGNDLKYHGSYNRVFLFSLMAVCFVIQHFFTFLYLAIKRIGLIKGLIGIVLLILIATFSLHFKLVSSCNNWRKGLGDSELDNNIEGCKIKEPYYCWMNFMDNVFDVSGWMGENCEQIRMDNREQLVRWTRIPSAKVVGYPRVEKWRFFPDSTLNEFQFRVLASTIDMEDPRVPQTLKDRTEIIIDFKKKNPEMSLRVTKDESLVQKRTNVRSSFKNNKFISKNVIHLFIDSLSRDNFRRKLPKARAWLERFYKNQNSEARVYQFLKYHGIASWTFINMVPTTFGVDGSHQGNPVHSNRYYKEKGFITGQAHNYCGREFYDLEPGNVEKFVWEPFDHEANLLGCDPNYSVPGHPFAIFNGPYGMKRRCLYGKDSSWYVFDYGKKFWKAYADSPKHLRLAFLDAHEGTGEVVKYMDDKLVDFFEFLESEGSLKDTVIVFQSDHGVNMPGFYTFVDAQDFWIEKTLPTLFLIVPQDVAKDYDEVLREKENLLLSPYDIHNTFLHLANSSKMSHNNVGKSLFEKTNDREERNCDKFRVVDPYCQCIGERE
jgi:hypothetical protein